ncbi:hypothetical protein RHGRI_007552 [Rhododendron griersonianum]|uniref:Uncharacterized protein n=1 Tax=Rhododendron griersonianum TaxID=479676 RepID=A0AAV6KZ66_9ERIC|nr:hypothetical protein RHGRI_007552 [Rhododendron griersonianum]
MPPLPSYGYGIECPGPRYGSLIHGQNLKNVVITVRHWALPPRSIPRHLPVAFNISNFGAVGNGVTVNTEVFERAVLEIRNRGGGLGIGLRHRSISRAI